MRAKSLKKRTPFTCYLNSDEKKMLDLYAKRINAATSESVRRAMLFMATHPEYDCLEDKKVLFKIDIEELKLTQQILPYVTALVKTISDLSIDHVQSDTSDE